MNNLKYTGGLIQAFKNSQIISQRCKLGYVGTEELLYGLLLLPNCEACKYLNKFGVNKSNYFVLLQNTFSKTRVIAEFNTPRFKSALADAEKISERAGVGFVSTEHLLLAILKKRDCVASSLIRKMNIDYEGLQNALEDKVFATAKSVSDATSDSKSEDAGKPESNPLDKFGYDLTEKARQGKLDPVIGRTDEIRRTIQVLSRRTKNNPVLIGEPGVGKTAIAEGLAQRIVTGEVPFKLRDKEVYLLDLTALVAGTQFRGQFESRMKGLIEEIRKLGNVILVIDEVHNIVGAGDAEGSMNAANILKPALSRGEIQVIGATTFAEYRKHIEKDAALERRFQPVTVAEPSIDDSVEILKGVRRYYEDFHGVTISDEMCRMAVTLSNV